jgi:hypothetical protein
MLVALGEQCDEEQQRSLTERLAALDAEGEQEWSTPLDRRLAQVPDRQGYGSEGGSVRRRRLRINTS